ncbi:hypothetical protein NLI96_g11854 [Meripilus lineatus]|uniref:Uncharacterized protein n=1 Tax=Meripilus lineatus TaxID=2056292 RepID=A0AAD5UR62_9APHY|nr:hypothetical protein NLI96_g11854 [Physisporinus lineatus]
MIDRLNLRLIRSWMYEDIDWLADDVHDAPKDVKRINQVSFTPKRGLKSAGSAVALSVAPLRLAGQHTLTNLHQLKFGDLHGITEPEFHPLSCPLYGRAFPDVTHIQFYQFHFPSFIDFAFFVTSFPSLTSLKLWNISCLNQVFTPSVERGPKKRNLRLTELQMEGSSVSERWFAERFLWWFLRRCGHFPEKISFDESLFDHLWGRATLRTSSETLQELTIWLDSETRRSQGDHRRDAESWVDAFIPGYPIADTVELWFFTEGDIPMLKTFIARHMRPEQRLELKAIRPTAEDFYAFSWKILDALLSSWYMMHSREDSQTLILSLNVPPKLWDERQTDKETAPKAEDEENPWLHALFPLTMALGEELWLGYCGEQRG